MDSASLNLRPAVVELVVDDMAATLAFYRRVGLSIPADADGETHVDVALGDLRLAFDTRSEILDFNPGWTPPSGGHRAALSFAAGSPAEVDVAYAALVADGATGHVAPWNASWGMRYAVVLDPDGTPVDIFAVLDDPS